MANSPRQYVSEPHLPDACALLKETLNRSDTKAFISSHKIVCSIAWCMSRDILKSTLNPRRQSDLKTAADLTDITE